MSEFVKAVAVAALPLVRSRRRAWLRRRGPVGRQYVGRRTPPAHQHFSLSLGYSLFTCLDLSSDEGHSCGSPLGLADRRFERT